jgi:predicted ArsR family transcriptional regulator
LNHDLRHAGAVAERSMAQRLLAALDEHAGLTVEEAAEELGVSRRLAAALLVRLGADGHVVPEGRRWFRAA